MANRFVRDYKETERKIRKIDEEAAKLKAEILDDRTVPAYTGRAFYVSEKGDDANDGFTPETAVRSLARASELPVQSGDAVLFERGGTFRGQLTAKPGVIYSAYGEGKKPNVWGSARNYADPALWEDTGINNVWKLKTPLKNDAGLIVFDDGAAWSEKRIKGRPDFPDGGIENLDCDLALWHDVPAPTKESGFVYLRSDKGNPGARFSSVEIAVRANVVRVTGNNVTVNNLCIRYGAAHGVGAGSCEGLTVSYCEFGWIGGAWFRTDTLSRYGNAIEIYGFAKRYTADHNYIYQIYDAGITHQFSAPANDIVMENIQYSFNLVEDTSYSFEYFNKEAEAGFDHHTAHCVFRKNILRRSGFGFGHQRPDKSQAAHIKGWDHCNETTDFVIEDNIFDRGRFNLLHIGAGKEEWLPVMRNNTYVQYDGGLFAKFGVNPTPEYPFDDTLDAAGSALREQNAAFYFAEPIEE